MRMSYSAVAIAWAWIRNEARGLSLKVVGLVNKLDVEARTGRQGCNADLLSRLDVLILDDLDYIRFAHDEPKEQPSRLTLTKMMP
jgi:DNA replication protein DnaC